MKKIISIIAALAMVGAFVGCGPIDFSEHTETLINSSYKDTAYYITDAEIISGDDVIELSLAKGSSVDKNTVTLTSKKTGDALVRFTSSVSAKKADVFISVYGSGMISGLTKLKYTTYNASEAALTPYHESTVWVDDPKSLNTTESIPSGMYEWSMIDDENSSTWNYIKIDGNIIYYMHCDDDNPSPSTDYYHWARGVITQTEKDKIASILWDTYGRADDDEQYSKLRFCFESHSRVLYGSISVKNVPPADLNASGLAIQYAPGTKELTFGGQSSEQVYKKMNESYWDSWLTW